MKDVATTVMSFFDGPLTIVEAPKVRAELVGMLSVNADCHLDLSAVTRMDLSILQLLIAARAMAAANDAQLSLAPPAFDLDGFSLRCGVAPSSLPARRLSAATSDQRA